MTALVEALVIVGGLALSLGQWPSPTGKLAFGCYAIALLVFVGALAHVGGLR